MSEAEGIGYIDAKLTIEDALGELICEEPPMEDRMAYLQAYHTLNCAIAYVEEQIPEYLSGVY